MFVALAVIGIMLLVVALLFDDVLDGLLPDLDVFGSELLSGPVIGAFLGATGIVGWMLQAGAGAPGPVALGGGLASGAVLGWGTGRAVRALMHTPTDATPRASDLVGRSARVVTGVQAGGIGEIVVSLGGQPVKLTATAGRDLPVGAEVTVVALESATKVVVEASEEFWG